MRMAVWVLMLAGCFTKPAPPEVFRRSITVTSPAREELVNFPLAIVIAGDSKLAALGLTGQDFAFATPDGGRLECEIVAFDAVAGTVEAWVLVPTVPAEPSTFELELHYARDGITPCTSELVWTEFVGVWHTDGDVTIRDSTSNAYDMTANVDDELPISAEGIVGQALQYDGVNDKVCHRNASFAPSLGTSSFTYAVWVNASTSVGDYDAALHMGGGSVADPGFSFGLGLDSWAAYLSDGITPIAVKIMEAGPTDAWVHIAAVIDRASMQVRTFHDGIYNAEGSLASFGSVNTTHDPICLGRASQPFAGRIDEARVHAVPRSVQWLLAEYINLARPGDMIEIGPELTP